MNTRANRFGEAGVSLVEVLVAMVIVAIGLLSLVVLHGRLHVLQVESYQRSQALIILNDMASRIQLNRNDADAYVTGAADPIGIGMVCPVGPAATRQEADVIEWCSTLQGAAESIGGDGVGAMLGARACVENIAAGEYLLTVAWQGMSPLSAPPASVGCGADLYDGAGDSPCVNDLCRRVVTTVVQIATLT
jgi:type IV pilus assembly protein PilV